MAKKIIASLLGALMIAVSTTGCINTMNTTTRTTETLKPSGELVTVTEELTDHMVFNEQAGKHSQFESQRISGQATAIATNINQSGVSGDAKALLVYLGNESIAGINPVEFGGKPPMTITEGVVAVTTTVVGGVAQAAPYAAAYGAVKAVADMKGGTQIVASGDGNTISSVTEENHATAIGSGNYANTKAGSSGSGDEEYDTCEQAVQAAEENCDLEGPLGDVMTCLSAESGCQVDIIDKQVMIDGEFPHHYLNSKWASHPELGGSEE